MVKSKVNQQETIQVYHTSHKASLKEHKQIVTNHHQSKLEIRRSLQPCMCFVGQRWVVVGLCSHQKVSKFARGFGSMKSNLLPYKCIPTTPKSNRTNPRKTNNANTVSSEPSTPCRILSPIRIQFTPGPLDACATVTGIDSDRDRQKPRGLA